jgi:hypothetical protein
MHFVVRFVAVLLVVVALVLTVETRQGKLPMVADLVNLVVPPKGMTRSAYFRQSQWRSDARTLLAAIQYLWESTTAPAAQGGDREPGAPTRPKAPGQGANVEAIFGRWFFKY